MNDSKRKARVLELESEIEMLKDNRFELESEIKMLKDNSFENAMANAFKAARGS